MTTVPSGGSYAFPARIGETENNVHTETSAGESSFKTWAPGSYAANKAKKLEMGALMTLLQKEKQENHGGTLETSESERGKQ